MYIDLSLPAFLNVDYESACHFEDIWKSKLPSVDGLQSHVLHSLLQKLDQLETERQSHLATQQEQIAKHPIENPLGSIIIGSSGSGKTHLMNVLRQEAIKKEAFFLVYQLQSVMHPSKSLVSSILLSLEQPVYSGEKQIERLFQQLFTRVPGLNISLYQKFKTLKLEAINPALNQCLVKLVHYQKPPNTQFFDIFKALLITSHNDNNINSLGKNWLINPKSDKKLSDALGIRTCPSLRQIASGLSWLLSRVSSTVLVFDQLDATLLQNFHIKPKSLDVKGAKQKSIACLLTSELSDLWTDLFFTINLITCRPTTWHTLQRADIHPILNKFERPKLLKHLPDSKAVQGMIESRLTPCYKAFNYRPPYTSYPFPKAVSNHWIGLTPRQVLHHCFEHQRLCSQQSQMIECQATATQST